MTLSDSQIDAIREIINIGVGRAAGILNGIVQKHIELSVPEISYPEPNNLIYLIDPTGIDILSSVSLPFTEGLYGSAKLIFPKESASKLVTLFTEEEDSRSDLDGLDLDGIRIGTLSEIGNIVLNSLIGTISNFLSIHLTYSIPIYFEGRIESLIPEKDHTNDLLNLYARTRFVIASLEITGDFVLFLELGSFEKLLNIIDGFNIDSNM